MGINQFASRTFLCGWVLLCVMLFAGTSCSDNDNSSPEEQAQVYHEGDEIVSQLLVDDALVEELEEEVVNFGNKEMPAMFFIRKSHAIRGQEVEDGSSSYNVYRSLKRENLEKFIVSWGQVIGVPVVSGDDSAENKARKIKAFWLLASYLRENQIDPAVLVKLAERNNEDVQALVTLIDESHAVTMRSNSAAVRPNELLIALEKSETTAKTLVAAIESEGETPQSFFAHCERSGIDFPATLVGNTRNSVTKIIKGVVKGIEILSKVLIFFIENGAPTVNMEDQYINFFHADDLDPMNYAGATITNSKKYEVRYGSKSSPLAKAVFRVETVYNTKHRTLPGTYIARVGMIVDEVRCSGMMHVDGRMEFTPPFENAGTEANPIASAVGSIWVNYGDCCAFSRHAYLNFRVSGDTGYKEITWNPKK